VSTQGIIVEGFQIQESATGSPEQACRADAAREAMQLTIQTISTRLWTVRLPNSQVKDRYGCDEAKYHAQSVTSSNIFSGDSKEYEDHV
jgi:hypothetical protein